MLGPASSCGSRLALAGPTIFPLGNLPLELIATSSVHAKGWLRKVYTLLDVYSDFLSQHFVAIASAPSYRQISSPDTGMLARTNNLSHPRKGGSKLLKEVSR